MNILNGNEVSNHILLSLDSRIKILKEKDINPHLSVILIGDNKDSIFYFI